MAPLAVRGRTLPIMEARARSNVNIDPWSIKGMTAVVHTVIDLVNYNSREGWRESQK